SGDPFFSLDPVDGTAWTAQGREALDVVWSRIKDSFSDRGASGFAIETFSVKRRYPSVWAQLEQRYPELRSRLVFRPEALRETRFGEILYKADVLLKELTSGVSIIQSGIPLRASTVPGYIPSDQRGIARSFLVPDHLRNLNGWTGHRLWFDLMPQEEPNDSRLGQNADSAIDRYRHPDLYTILLNRGFVGGRAPNPIQRTALYSNGDVIDLSEVYPKMFVRRHDHSTRQDVKGADPDLDLLSRDVNERTVLYVNAYQELRDLTDVFRAYVASAKLVQKNDQIWGTVRGLPLTEGEKISTRMPELHPSELFITVAHYTWTDRRGRSWELMRGGSNNGGIALRGKAFSAAAAVEQETPIISEVRQELAAG